MSETQKTDVPIKWRELVQTLDTVNALTEPLINSITNLLTKSAKLFNSEDASIIVRANEEGDLKFLCAIGEVADQLKNVVIPAGKGVAGFVFSSGQPLAIADAGQTESFYDEIDKKTGYNTQIILATPLTHNDEVIGVLEYINRKGSPPYKAFTSEEMDRAAYFAEAFSALVYAYESARFFRALGGILIKDSKDSDVSEIRNWLKNLRSTTEHREMIDLAIMVQQISKRGESERKFCNEVLQAFLRYENNRNDISFLTF